MSLIVGTDVLIQCRYQATIFILFSDGSMMNVDPSRITGINIESMYETGKLPIFKLSLLMESTEFFKIIKDKDNVKFQIRIQKYGINLVNKKRTMVKDVINTTFGLFIDENPEDLEVELRKRKNNNQHKSENISNIVDLYLFKNEIIEGLLQPSNIIIRDTTMSSLVTHLLYQAGCRKILMAPFDNITEYSRVILPPQSIYDNIKWLDNYYGFYKTGSLIFFDSDKTYVLKYGPECTAWTRNELTDTTILISQNSKESESTSGMIQRGNQNQNYINGNAASMQIINNILDIKLTLGSDASFINSSNNEINSISSNDNDDIAGGYDYIIDNGTNPYLSTTYEQRLKSEEIIVNITITDHDYTSLSPNKRLNLIFEDQSLSNKYNGVYRVATAIHKFLRDGDDLVLASVLSLKKMK